VAAQGSVQGEVISDCCTGTSNSAPMQKLEKETTEGETWSCNECEDCSSSHRISLVQGHASRVAVPVGFILSCCEGLHSFRHKIISYMAWGYRSLPLSSY